MVTFIAYLLVGVFFGFAFDLVFVELALILIFRAGGRLFLHPWFDQVELYWARLAIRRNLCVAMAFVVPILIRVALLPFDPMPQPWIPDEFSHLLIGDTLAHGRFANPTHPLWQHFESVHIFFKPTYASSYFPGLGIVLASGQLLGHPWLGVLLSSGAMCAALLWMLYGFFPVRWALLGGVLAVLRWGALSYWVNSYWGGTVAAAAGALVLGAYARLRKRASISNGLWMGLGLVFLAYSRPLEGLALAVPVAFALVWNYRKLARFPDFARLAIPITLVVAVGLIGLGAYFKAITGSPFVMPYRMNQAMYAWPLTLPWEHLKPTSYRHADLQLYYEWERCVQFQKTWPKQALLFASSHLAPLWRFFLGPALTVPLLGILRWWRDRRIRVLLVSLAVSLTLAVIIVAYPHYIAPVTACSLALCVQGFRHLRAHERKTTRSGLMWSRIAVTGCLIMLPVRAFVDSNMVQRMRPGMHTFSALGNGQGGNGQGMWRADILRRLQAIPGHHVVFAQYDRPAYLTTEWVYNDADIDGSQVVWAQDMGHEKNQEVLRYYPDRKAWLVKVDDAPGTLLPYRPELAQVGVTPPIHKEICFIVPQDQIEPKIHLWRK
jgi:hypothetical protein